jgi:hypothetical protein
MLRRIRWRGVIVPALLGCCAALGCRSSVSTHVERGPLGYGWTTQKMAGVPVTVKMPTHLRVEVIEQRYLTSDNCLVPDAQGRPLVGHRVQVTVQEKDQVFTVDSVRPAAGKLTYQAEFEDQYFKSLNTKVEDETIQKVTAAIGKFDPTPLKQLGKGTAKAQMTGGESAKVQLVESTVAAAVFDLSDPEMECHLREFLREYTNACHECRAPLAPGSCSPPFKK